MKVSIELSPEYSEPYAIIYADKITDSIQRTLDIFGSNESPITAFKNENDIVILQPKEIYMVRVENKDTIIYGKEHRYRSRKRLYEMQQQLGAGFMQISKSTLVNLSYMSNVEAGFSGTLLLKLKTDVRITYQENICLSLKISGIIGGQNERNYENLIKNTITSIGIALTVFCVTGMVFDIAYDGNFSLDNYQFSKMVIGCLIVGLGFGLPTMIYHKDNLPTPFKVIIHMGTGCVIYTIVAYTVGWIGGTSSVLHGIIAAIFQIAMAFIIWGGFMLHYRNDARK